MNHKRQRDKVTDMREGTLELSVVLPTYKERENLAVFVPQIEEGFMGMSFEIIIVDDNSGDGTKELVADLNRQYGNIHMIERVGLLGIGSALRDGYNAARGKYILSSDADLSFSVFDMQALHQKINEGNDMVLGYKVESGEAIEKKRESMPLRIKNVLSELGNWLIRIISGMGRLKNFNTNFRIIRRSLWEALDTREDRNFFLFETIFKAKKRGAKITEIPVLFYNRKFGESKLNFFKEAPKYFSKLLRYTLFAN